MPLQVIEATDPITNLVQFRISPIYEMIISLQTLLKPGQRSRWADATRLQLPLDFLEELRSIYEPFWKGSVFFELAVDYNDHQDVEGFIDYVRTMDPVKFIFYLIGRILPPEEIAATGLHYGPLEAAMQQTQWGDHCMCLDTPLVRILDDIPAFQNRLADLWLWYWDIFFKDQIASLRPHWQKGIDDKTGILVQSGGTALYETVTGKPHLLDPMPPDHPITEVVFVPLYLIPGSVFIHYGYGNITVLFDSEHTEARRAELARSKEELLTLFKALGDNSRMDILRLIARFEGDMHGKKIAAKLNLSPSAVSRHVNQLKDAGLIIEESHDNRTITYRLQPDTIRSLPERLMEVLYV